MNNFLRNIRKLGSRRNHRFRPFVDPTEVLEVRNLLSGAGLHPPAIGHAEAPSTEGPSSRPISAVTDKVHGRASFAVALKTADQKASVHDRDPAPATKHAPVEVAMDTSTPAASLSSAWINYLILLGKEDPTLAYNNIVTDVRNDVITAGDGEEILWGINPGWFNTAPFPTVGPPSESGSPGGNGQGYSAGGIQSVAGFLPFQDVTVTGTPLAGTPYFSAFTVTGHNAANTASGSFSYSTQRYGSGYAYNFTVIIHSGAFNYGYTGTAFQPYYQNSVPFLVALENPIYTF